MPVAPESGALTCPLVLPGTMGVWFRVFVHDPICLKASTVGSQFDTIIAIYRGDSCATMTCVAENDNATIGVRFS